MLIWEIILCPLIISFHTQSVKMCEYFTYELDTEDCNLYEVDAEAGTLVEDPNFVHGPRICPTGSYGKRLASIGFKIHKANFR